MAQGNSSTGELKKPLDVIIIGGSLTGLMHGVMLKRLGHNVRILEKQEGSPESQMAGIATGDYVKDFLDKFDRIDSRFASNSECFQSIDYKGHIKSFLATSRAMTSWDAFFFRLRANFDGLRSEYYPEPPQSGAGDGTASYESGRQVTDLSLSDRGVCVRFDHLVAGKLESVDADLVLAADGPNSIVRRRFMPVDRPYSGYVVWRGVVPEAQVSRDTRECFQENITYLRLHGEHAIVYNIPGPRGTLKSGERFINFAWYSNHSPSALSDIMTDQNGHKHNATVLVRDDIWEKQCRHGKEVFTAPFIEIMGKISSPFVQQVTDYSCPRAAFLEGKVLIVGDALALFRPHIAFSTNQAAFDCLQLERYLDGKMELLEWETEVVQFGHLHWLRSVWWGESYQRGRLFSILSALRYWLAVAVHLLHGRHLGPQ